jgi:hypothetical protein
VEVDGGRTHHQLGFQIIKSSGGDC